MDTQNEKINYIQIFGKSLPFMSIFLVVIGYIKTYLFYTAFGIDITPYITLSDLPFIIPPDLFFLIPILVFSSLPFVFFYKEQKKENSNILIPQVIGYHYTIYDPKNDKSLIKVRTGFLVLLGILSVFSIVQLIIVTDFKDKLTHFINICAIVAMVWFFKNIDPATNPKISSTKTIILIVFLALIFPSIKLITSIRKIGLGFYNNTTIITKSDTITSKKDYIYVGGLSGHVFFYNKKKNSHTIIPRSEIVKIDIHQREYPFFEDSITTK